MLIKSNNIDEIYRVCYKYLTNSCCIRNKAFDLNEVMFELTDVSNNIVNVRNISVPYLCGEMLWYMLGRKDIEFIHKFSTVWSRISDDGVNCNSAYGDIIFNRHGFNQLEKIIELLKTDKDTRRAVINLNVPNKNVIETKDEICTISLTFYIRNNKLYCSTCMRSNDFYTGLPYDVAFFTELQKLIANELNIECGSYFHHAISLHLYLRNIKDLVNCVNKPINQIIHFDLIKLNEHKYLLEECLKDLENPRDVIEMMCRNLDIVNYEEV